MTTEIRDLLESVAAGNTTPAQASERITALRADEAGAQFAPAEDQALETLRQIVIRAPATRLTVIADPSVAEAVAEGVHSMERRGDALIITSTPPGPSSYVTDAPKSAFMSWVAGVVDKSVGNGQSMVVRVNPDLYLRVLVIGGTLDLRGLRAGAAIGIEAGSATIADCVGPCSLDVSTGEAKVNWKFVGESKIRTDMGSIKLQVDPESDVTITAEASMGQAVVTANGTKQKSEAANAMTAPVVVGSGAGTLHAVVRMGAIKVTV